MKKKRLSRNKKRKKKSSAGLRFLVIGVVIVVLLLVYLLGIISDQKFESTEEIIENSQEGTEEQVVKDTSNACEPNLVCTAWGPCLDGVKFRACKDLNFCEGTTKEEFEECEEGESDQFTEIQPKVVDNYITQKTKNWPIFISGILFLILFMAIISFNRKKLVKKKQINKAGTKLLKRKKATKIKKKSNIRKLRK